MDIKRILEIEAGFARTPKGRHIGEKMISRIQNEINNPKIQESGYMSCMNCGFVMEEAYFIAGCPNCGCKDVEVFSPLMSKKSV